VSRIEEVFERPLDAFLLRLRWHLVEYRPDLERLDIWLSTCPCCGETLTIREYSHGGQISVWCRSDCERAEIDRSLDIEALSRRLEHALAAGDATRETAAWAPKAAA
jgi:hypothetical protein